MKMEQAADFAAARRLQDQQVTASSPQLQPRHQLSELSLTAPM